MRNIGRIFIQDFKRILTNLFVLIIVAGLCILPSLYAWFNIYSNWDPYANTANIRVAVATMDTGCALADGTWENMGDSIVSELQENKKIGWVITDQADAVNGVYNGSYYAAVVIDSNFTESIVNFLQEGSMDPTITYYENEKKNAVATKITDTAVTTLKQSINEKFIETITSTLFTKSQQTVDDVNADGGIDTLKTQLESVNENLQLYSQTLDLFLQGNTALKEAIAQAESGTGTVADDLEAGRQDIAAAGDAIQTLQSTDATLSDFQTNLENNEAAMEAEIAALQTDISELLQEGQPTAEQKAAVETQVAQLQQQVQTIRDAVTEIAGTDWIPEDVRQKLATLQSDLENVQSDAARMKQVMNDATTSVQQKQEQMQTLLDSVSGLYQNNLKGEAQQTVEQLQSVLNQIGDLLGTMENSVAGMSTLYDGIDMTVDSTSSSMQQMQQAVQATSGRLTALLDKLNAVEDSEQFDTLMKFLQGDAKSYGEFFSSPVEVTTQEIYPISNYGSAMTPFYSVLALWVGALILVALLKVKPRRSDFPTATPNQLFFGRYLLFFVLGQIQAAIIVGGDILLLHCQVQNWSRFWLAAAVTSFVFTLLVYALTLAFGDIGKAFAVVILVIQIAGSGGTYPIELLPTIYQQIYIFFPFPYAINAMRETVGGPYGNVYEKNIIYLLLFALAGLAIGLFIRKPFMGINHFVEKRMEDTKLM